jgi:hypothetical protein
MVCAAHHLRQPIPIIRYNHGSRGSIGCPADGCDICYHRYNPDFDIHPDILGLQGGELRLMVLPYDLTNASNMSGVTDLFTTANQLTNDMFGVVIMLMIWFIIFMQLKNYDSRPAMLAASFITSLAAVLLFVFNMIGQNVLVASIVMTAIAFAVNWHNG